MVKAMSECNICGILKKPKKKGRNNSSSLRKI